MLPTHVLFRETDAFNGQKKKKNFSFRPENKSVPKTRIQTNKGKLLFPIHNIDIRDLERFDSSTTCGKYMCETHFDSSKLG